ncbi:MAG: HEAT repeat domain-containing protein [Planctomycetes bacterium]|nr:HEAT repeat domain-containing protein [Planctomycetota bacterium]
MLRAEPGETHTFERKPVAFALCLDLPSGIFLHHGREVAEEEVYSTYAKLTLYLGDRKVPLEKLEVPRGIRVRKAGEAIGGLRRGMTHADAWVRAAAANRLGEFGPDAAPAVPDLVRLLEGEKHPYPRRVAAQALGRIGVKGEEVNAALRAAAGAEEAEVREAAEEALRALVFPKDPHAKRREAIAAYVEKRRAGAKEGKEVE